MLAAKLIFDVLFKCCYIKVLKINITECSFPPHSSLLITYMVHRELFQYDWNWPGKYISLHILLHPIDLLSLTQLISIFLAPGIDTGTW